MSGLIKLTGWVILAFLSLIPLFIVGGLVVAFAGWLIGIFGFGLGIILLLLIFS